MPDGSAQFQTVAERRQKGLSSALWDITQARWPGPQQGAVKRALVMLWSMADPDTRAAFLARLALPPGYEFMPVRKHWAKASQDKAWLRDPELQEAANYWSYVLKGVDPEKYGFASSLSKAIRMPSGPSEKQARAIVQMYRDYKRWSDVDGDEGSLIDEG